ncbi:hypothetical protein GAU_0592 [Gemmatimonas aurantiaca T-27]|uniref:Ice-binding protein C-terminal domain-containing protein n=2 Tax=Gemmatimonas aurantiaca TaxID=173480 RepID=C1A5X4_GEMAT|nr:PEP-CTERM sorting domain-containing protein [Gemmatimonas aurantiaca]BAH37634.1 hypothetical protein GAU_0592 [Gemmatimonas aurantiaca T-27]
MIRRMFAALAGSALLALPASAQTTVLLQDDFNSLSQGIPYTSPLANFTVMGTSIDVVQNGNYSITCVGNTGACVDLDGTPGPGGLASKISYAFAAGDVVRLQFSVSGNQRTAVEDDLEIGFTFDDYIEVLGLEVFLNGGSILGPADVGVTDFLTLPTAVAADQPWSTLVFQFTVGSAANIGFSLSSNSADNVGPVIDDVLFTRTSTTVPEPSTYALMAAGLMAMAAVARRRRA